MVKYTLSFLISFKDCSPSDTNLTIDPDTVEENQTEESYLYYFKPHHKRMNICNIQYHLPGPKKSLSRQISIASWSKLVKVYTHHGVTAHKTNPYRGKTWAAFSVRHELDDFNLDQIKIIYKQKMEFAFNDSVNLAHRRLRKEKSSGTYWYKKMEGENETKFEVLNEFVVEKTKKLKKKKRPNSVRTIRSLRSSRSQKSKRGSYGQPMICSSVAGEHFNTLMSAMERISFQSEQEPIPDFRLILPASHLLFDKPVWSLNHKNPLSSNIEEIYVFISVESFLKNSIRMKTRPFSISVRSLESLPLKELKKNEVTKVCVEYELEPLIPVTRTKFVECENQVYFDDIKVYLTNETSPLMIISSLQSRRLFVRILGLKEPIYKADERTDIKFFGRDFGDNYFSSCIKSRIKDTDIIKTRLAGKLVQTKSQRMSRMTLFGRASYEKKKPSMKKSKSILGSEGVVVLGHARIDLSRLVFGSNCIIAYKQITSYKQLIYATPPESEFIDHFTITEAHVDLCDYEQGILDGSSLYLKNTVLKVVVKTGDLLTPRNLKADPSLMKEAFSRSVAIFNDKNFATHILKYVLTTNDKILNDNNFLLPLVPWRKTYKFPAPEKLKSYYRETSELKPKKKKLKPHFDDSDSQQMEYPLEPYFTGFCIDFVDKVIMFIEGPTLTLFPSFLVELFKIDCNQGKLLYSSDLMYEFRLYDAFKRHGGMFCITSQNTIENLLKIGIDVCYGGAIPTPAWRVIENLSKLLTCNSLLEAVQLNYLPRPEQLLSFDIEFGIPHCMMPW